MRRALLVILVVAVGLTFAAGTIGAQPKQGDLVFCVLGGSSPGVYYKTWPSGAVMTLTSGTTLAALKVPHGNGYVYASGGSTGNIYRYDKAGVRSTMTTVTTRGDAIGVDQDGTHIIANYNDRTLYRLSGTTCTAWMTLPTTYGPPNALCRDGNTGDWIVGTYSGTNSKLLRVDRLSKSVSVVSSLTGGAFAVDWIPQTGEYVVALSGRVSFIRANGSLRSSTVVASKVFNSVTVDHKKGRVFAGTADGYVYEWTYAGSYRGNRLVLSGANLSGIDMWDDQNISIHLFGSGSNSYARAMIKFNESLGKSYYVAMSAQPTNGINLGTAGWVNLRADPLFFLTFGGKAPHFTQGFSGVLSASGLAYARFRLPYSPIRVYVTAVAVNVAKPGALDVGNVEVVDLW